MHYVRAEPILKVNKSCPYLRIKTWTSTLQSFSKKVSSLLSFLVELVIYAGFVISYFFLVLHFLGGWLGNVFKLNKIHYAFLALGLIVVQGVVLERLTSGVMWMIQRLQALIPALTLLARPQETISRPKDAPEVLIYRFAGPLLAFNSDYFARRVRKVMNEADKPITLFLINAEAIIDMDRIAVETLDELHSIMKEKNIELGLCEVKGNFRKMLMSTPLPRRVGFNIYPSVATAIEKLNQESLKGKK